MASFQTQNYQFRLQHSYQVKFNLSALHTIGLRGCLDSMSKPLGENNPMFLDFGQLQRALRPIGPRFRLLIALQKGVECHDVILS